MIHGDMQSDPTVISLRPGGRNRGGRIFAHRFDSAAYGAIDSSNLPVRRPLDGAGEALSVTVGGECSREILRLFFPDKGRVFQLPALIFEMGSMVK